MANLEVVHKREDAVEKKSVVGVLERIVEQVVFDGEIKNETLMLDHVGRSFTYVIDTGTEEHVVEGQRDDCGIGQVLGGQRERMIRNDSNISIAYEITQTLLLHKKTDDKNKSVKFIVDIITTHSARSDFQEPALPRCKITQKTTFYEETA